MEIIKLELQMKVYTSHAAYKIFSIFLCSFMVVYFYLHGTRDCTDSVLWAVHSERLRTGFLFGKDHAKASNPTFSAAEINNEFGNHLLVR